jgi:hypothetical protein
MTARKQSRNVARLYLSHAYGEPLATDWCNTPLIVSSTTHATHDSMSCYASARRAPRLDEYDHDAQGF